MDYNVFKKTITTGGKIRHYWYYWYIENGRQVQKACKGCKTMSEAWEYVQQLQPLSQRGFKIRDVAAEMFLMQSDHVKRRRLMGQTVKEITMNGYRTYTEMIIEQWGNYSLHELAVKDVMDYLFHDPRSASWKNQYIAILTEVFSEGIFQGCSVPMPAFHRFIRNSKKADVFTSEEIKRLFQIKNWENRTFYYMFLLCLTGGLRLGEARAFRACQFHNSQKIVIDGFMSRTGTRHPYNKGGSSDNLKARISVVPARFVNILCRYINRRELKGDDLLFTYRGKPIRQEYAEKAFKRALAMAGISPDGRKLVPHSLRYTWVTRLRRDLPKELVQILAGHSSPEMTDYYTKSTLQDLSVAVNPAVESVNNFFK
ncbi:MAG: tyrosine-type recombinase/integrase [Spirochaetia bacterium]|nr:tyrosine-type recombinase/integrase [Spirochaetia bacterium]